MSLPDDPHWYRDAVIYELHVRSFMDSNGDGIGDFKGLTSKLDYLADLGVTALWLLPFYPSPLRDDGYDIADYTGVNPSYGTLRDLRTFLRAAHDRGLRVITELVMNHTSDQHEWFQKARSSPPGSKWREFYVWSDTAEEYPDARIIFQDFESSNWTWDPVAGAYYWHRFYSHQPDLNFENPEVRAAMFSTLDRWFEMGVDGVRLDAVPYLFEREGTNCENLPETHEFLKELRAHVDSRWDNRMFLAEANQWPEDAAAYFGDGDECHMNFHFPVMPRLFMSLRMEDRLPIIDILEQTPDLPEGAQWATFLRNHDELTLEMVTDEERDYMVRAYADDPQARINLGIRRRLAPLLENDRRKTELMNGLLFSLPGTPVVYYGDEIGMGDNFYLGDRDSVRTPMQWTADRNAGFSRANPQQLFLPPVIDPEYHYEKVNVESQQRNPSSLLWWMRRLIALRKRHPVFGRGDLEFIDSDNAKVLSFTRSMPEGEETDRVLVVANLSRHAQPVELDLRHLQGLTPVEMFGHTRFAPIGELPYYLTLAPFQFFWFSLEPSRTVDSTPDDEQPLRTLRIDRDWHELFGRSRRNDLTKAIPDFITQRRWFAGKDRTLRGVKVREVLPVAVGRRKPVAYLVRTEVDYVGADSEQYLLTLTAAQGDRADELSTYRPDAVVARLERASGGDAGLLIDAVVDADFCTTLLETIGRSREHALDGGAALTGDGRPELRRMLGKEGLEVRLIGAEQSNTSVIFGDQVVMKLIRKVDAGENPEVEVGAALTAEGFDASARHFGALRYQSGGSSSTVAVAQAYVPNEGDAWSHTLDLLSRFFEHVVTTEDDPTQLPFPPDGPLDAPIEVPDPVAELVGPMLQPVDLLAGRLAELHTTLAGAPGEAFAPEVFSTLYQRSLYQSFRGQTRSTMSLVRRRLKDRTAGFDDALRGHLEDLLSRESDLLESFGRVRGHRIDARRIRIHGDLHLGQVLWTGRDMVIIDFEGEPSRPIGERRIKRSPLVDTAGILRSFHYATSVSLAEQVARGVVGDDPAQLGTMRTWGGLWRRWMEALFLSRYLRSVADAGLVPEDEDDRRVLLELYGMEKALYELRYELQYRPDWVQVPLASLLAGIDEGDS
ncbi:maltose alpha-D-glucosyltransferase [Actinomarinicola tropica]|uniref:Maltokinase n=1 Tax=Actinomarinicola tropica TaxID=2789776 RepID=A0A5Q2RHS5_9ACTN|nr:maltose alpha-D-glucosyltransferase [Actinomarinicola tropica]QGG96339.1 maltose alpha-D-glucosyltransferase [Actinomarinicola tropica]